MSDDCAIGGDKHGKAQPIVCLDCHLRTATNLDWIRRNYILLTDHLEPIRQPGRGRTGPSSRPPLRTDTLSLAAKGGITGILGSWVQLLAEDHAIDPPNYRLGQEALVNAQAQAIKANLTWMLEQDFAVELVNELSEIRTDIQHLFGDTERKWIALPGRWACPVIPPDAEPCGQPLRQRLGEWRIVCKGCGSEWIGEAEFERLGTLLGCEIEVTIEQAAALARVGRATIYRWIHANNLRSSTNAKGVTVVDTRDLALLVAQRTG